MPVSEEELKKLVLSVKLIDEEKLKKIEEYAKQSEMTLYDALVEKDVASDENLGLLVADYLKIPYVVLAKTSIPEDVFHIVPEKFARRQKMIAFSRDQNGIKIAMADPRNREALELISKKTGQKVIPHFSTERDITNTFHIYRRNLQRAFEAFFPDEIKDIDQKIASRAPTAKIVDLLIQYGYQDKASDLHIEPEENDSLVRFRIDGILQDVLRLPKTLHDQVVTRIKVLSRLRTDEHLSPQDGKMRIKLDEEDLDIRISIVPIVDGEKVVMRLLSSKQRQFSLVDLGMREEDLKKVSAAMKKSYGMILSTGPTGSGKTTSIYSIIKVLNSREKNITTIEDPVEYRIKGVNQIQVNPKAELTFASGLRSVLRQDPNIIFVGEIRDSETAGIAVNAALTGHLVVSTLHTNDAATSLPRLIDMDVEPYLVASTVNAIIAQRLVRQICEMCKTSATTSLKEISANLSPEIIKKNFGNATSITLYQGRGCKVCHFTGYQGRLGVFEVLEITKNIKKLITAKQDSDIILRQAVADGMTSMLDDGLQKVAKGLTTIEEVLRVTKVESA